MNKILLTILLATNTFWLSYTIMGSMSQQGKLMREVKSSSQRGFTKGCMAAFYVVGRISEGDPLEETYFEWCEKNAE